MTRHPRRALTGRPLAVTAALAATALLLGGCTTTGTGGSGQDASRTLRVVAGSEVKDMQPILDRMADAIDVHIDFTYMGTLDGTEALAGGELDGTADAVWFPSNRYLGLLDGGAAKLKRETKIMYSPVVLGLKQDSARRLGWDTRTPSWADIVTAVSEGRLTYGMTSPVSSNSGFSALIEAATALSGTGDALTADAVAKASDSLVAFSAGQELTSGSSGWLADKFAEDPSRVDGIVNYDSVLRGLSVDGKPLTIVTPSDGVITADYPFALLASAADEKAQLYDEAVSWLTTDEAQSSIAATTHRYTRTEPVNSQLVFELPFPGKLSVVQDLISTYLADIKKPSRMVFTIDTSGSMAGDRMDALKQALTSMTSQRSDQSFLTFRNRESVRYVVFSSSVTDEKEFAFTDSNRDDELAKATDYINGLGVGGGTAIYDALETSYTRAVAAKAEPGDSFTSVVLFTDGENNGASTFADFAAWYREQRSDDSGIQTIPTYVVRFGESSADEMQQIAELTGGRVFDATSDGGLTGAFAEIRGYQ